MMPLLEAQHLVKNFPLHSGFWGRAQQRVHAVSDVSLKVEVGETLGLVGESGCGKSSLARLLMRLSSPDAGKILFDGRDITRLSERKLRPLRREFQMVFQDPYASLNPRLTIGEALVEPLLVHGWKKKAERRERAFEMLAKVGLNSDAYAKYPHEFSGGQRQRIGIARALILNPKLVIADEPVSSLDVSIQAQILNLLQALQAEFQLTYILIAHDLKVVRHISQRILVMYLGHIVEEISSLRLEQARHPYTHALLAAVPLPDPRRPRPRLVLSGDVPSALHPPSGCVFRTRCPYAQELCARAVPELKKIGEGHWAACHLVNEVKPFAELEAVSVPA